MAQGACFPGMVAGDSLPQRDLQPKATKNQIYCWLRQPLQKKMGLLQVQYPHSHSQQQNAIYFGIFKICGKVETS